MQLSTLLKCSAHLPRILSLYVSKVEPLVLSTGMIQMTGDDRQPSVHHKTASSYGCQHKTGSHLPFG